MGWKDALDKDALDVAKKVGGAIKEETKDEPPADKDSVAGKAQATAAELEQQAALGKHGAPKHLNAGGVKKEQEDLAKAIGKLAGDKGDGNDKNNTADELKVLQGDKFKKLRDAGHLKIAADGSSIEFDDTAAKAIEEAAGKSMGAKALGATLGFLAKSTGADKIIELTDSVPGLVGKVQALDVSPGAETPAPATPNTPAATEKGR